MLRRARVSSFPRAHFLHFFRSIIIWSITTNFVTHLYAFGYIKLSENNKKERFNALKSNKFTKVYICTYQEIILNYYKLKGNKYNTKRKQIRALWNSILPDINLKE